MPSNLRGRSSSAFLRSINVEQDGDNPQILSAYLVTPNSIRSVKRALDALLNRHGGAWTITGPYGTGKSAFFVFLSHLLGSSVSHLTSQARRLLNEIDPELAKVTLGKARRKFNLIPVVVSGAPEPFSSAILRGLNNANQRGCLRLSPRLKRRLRNLRQVSEQGTLLNSHSVVNILEEIVDYVSQGGRPIRGILLIIDELGKLLEFSACNPRKSDPFVLQQLAELATRSCGHLLLFAGLHQDFRAYAGNLPPTERAEWEKIRGRFEDVAFEEPPNQLLRFVTLVWKRIREIEGIHINKKSEEKVRSLASRLWKYNLAPPGLTLTEGVELLTHCAPVHPLAAVLIGPLFRRIGQNERSAFTFLASEEPRALRSSIYQRKLGDKQLYDVIDLYNYLISSLGNALLNTIDSKRWAEVFEAEARHPELGAEVVAVLRATAILSICSRWSHVKATLLALKYALSGRLKPNQVKTALRKLESISLIIHRRYNDSYVLWEGSDIDVEARLAEGRQCLVGKSNVVGLLRRHYFVRPILARRHSFESGTLRFFAVDFLTTEELRKRNWPEDRMSDGHIFVVLPKNKEDRLIAIKATRNLEKSVVIRLLEAEGRFSDYALELAAIDWVKENTPELSHDATARRELHVRRISVVRAIDELFSNILYGNDYVDGAWYNQGTKIKNLSPRELNEKISSICDGIYSEAPRIDNEIINRRQLSSAAAAARRNLIRKMIESADQPSLGLTGNPPERSIYRSLLSEEGGLGLHRLTKGKWAFRKPRRSSSAEKMFQAISEFFKNAIDAPKQMDELFEILRRPPFGLRDGPIPIFVCVGFLVWESEVALYEDGAFCPVLTAAGFERLIKSPERFSVRRWQLSGVRGRVFEELERLVVGENVTQQHSRKRRLLNVARPLLRFIASLPEYTMQTNQLSPQTQAIRRAFEDATEPDVLLFESLPEACDLPRFSSRRSSRRQTAHLARYISAIKSSFQELRGSYPRLLESVRQSFNEVLGLPHKDVHSVRDALKGNARYLQEFAIERDLKLLFSHILQDDLAPDAWLEGIASFLGERPMPKWRDEDIAHFSIRLRQFVRRMELLTITLSDRPMQAGKDFVESVRVSLTGTNFGQLDHAIHLDKSTVKQARRIEERVEAVLSDGTDATVAVGALCRLLKRRLEIPQSLSERSSV